MKITKQYNMKINNQLPELFEERTITYSGFALDNPAKITAVMNNSFHLNQMAEEYVYMIGFNGHLDPLGIFLMTKGSADASIFPPREILQRAFMCGATNICIIHNHPSGHLLPSEADIAATKRLEEACNICGVILTDHIIIAGNTDGNEFYSFKEHGKIT